MFVCRHELPKIWMGRIQKYWDKFVPSDYPVSSSTFSVSFPSDAAVVAVAKMEDEIMSESCIALEAIPENTYVSNYVGVYDVTGTPGELTLLCPEKVSSENVIAMHYNEESSTWENIENIQIIDGYVWGTLESFSPIAVFEYKRDIIVTEEPLDITANHDMYVIANGNAIKIYSDEEGKVFVVGPKQVPIEISKKACIIGGTIDGTSVESTNISIIGVDNKEIMHTIYGGSAFYDSENGTIAEVGTINLNIVNSNVRLATGSAGAVRTNHMNVTVDNSVVYGLACGASMVYGKFNLDVNGDKELSYAVPAWIKSAIYNINKSEIYLAYLGTNAGRFFADKVICNLNQSKVDYFTTGGSNGMAGTGELVAVESTIGNFQTGNRGIVDKSISKFSNCIVEKLFVGGNDGSDIEADTHYIKIDINAGGNYNMLPGYNNKEVISTNDIIETIKVSRNANITITEEFVALLGEKYIVK